MDRNTLLRLEEFIPVLQKTIGKRRFLHSLGAMHYAAALADKHGEDRVRAAVAGVLHDCGRLPEIEQVKAEAERRCLDLPAEDHPHPKVWHAFLSAHMAEIAYGISDQAILHAIRYHSTGEVNATPLDKIIYLADYLEPTRSFEGLKELRLLAEQDLDAAFREALAHKLRHVQSMGRMLHPRSLRALAWAGGTLG